MVKFGEKLQSEAVPKWSHAYVDYTSLKRQLDLIRGQPEGSSREPLKQLFQLHLDAEIHKVLRFYASQSERVQERVQRLQGEQARVLRAMQEDASVMGAEGALQDLALEKLREAWREVGALVADLLNFVSLNMAAIRKILKKMGKTVGALAPDPQLGVSSALQISHPTEASKIVEGSFLPEEVVQDLNDMQRGERLAALQQIAKDHIVELLEVEVQDEADALGELGRAALSHREPILRTMSMARQRAERNSSLVGATTDLMAAQAAIFKPPPPDEQATATTLGLLLNSLNVLLYMTNYNLVLPMNAQYCRHLGFSSSVGGIIVGAADLTAMCASLLYSAWTNYSFRPPLMFAAICCLLGNVAYSLAFDMRSLPLLIVGRLVTGIGAARALNRRYIADFVSRKSRTKASAGFVAASAAGMALGPLLAFPLSWLPPSPPSLPLTINNITLAGWIMAAAWLLFMLVALPAFKEPRPPTPMCRRTPRSVTASPVKPPTGSLPHSNGSALKEPLLSVGEAASAAEAGRMALAAAQPRLQSFRSRSRGITAAAVCGLWLCILKLLQQGALASLPVIAGPSFGWGEALIGIFLGACGLSALPLNFLTGFICRRASDRALALSLIAILCTGCIANFLPSILEAVLKPHAVRAVTYWQYLPGFLLVYFSTLILEAAAMSLMSKVIPPSLAAGIFNAGLLATQAGSGGRLLGNVYVTLMGWLVGLKSGDGAAAVSSAWVFDTWLYGTFASAALVTLGVSLGYYDYLQG